MPLLVCNACSPYVFFQCEDRKVEFLHEALKKVGDRFINLFPPVISLSLHSSVSYLGFFMNDAHANVIKEFAVAFATEASILAGTINVNWKL